MWGRHEGSSCGAGVRGRCEESLCGAGVRGAHEGICEGRGS